MVQMQMNRKTATKLLIVQWSRFQELCVNLKGSTLFTGVNGSGKSTILDAMTYLLTGNTQFNKAARDRDRTVLAYVRGDTKSNGPFRYLRTGEIISYIAMEFWSPVENNFLVAGVCIESANETSQKSSYLVIKRDLRREKTGPALCFFGAGPGPPCFAEMIAEEAVFCKNFFVLRIS